MGFPAKSAVESIDSSSDASPAKKSLSGPPPAKPKPKSAADSSLFSSVGQSAQQAGQSGLGSEGSNPQILSMQGVALVTRGVQILNLANPDNPGLLAALADVMGRLQAILPQLSGGMPGQGGMGMGLFPQQMAGQPMPGAQAAPGGMRGGGMPPPPMAGGGPPMPMGQ